MTRRKCYGGVGDHWRCHRTPTWEAWFLGAWRPLCRYHVGSYYDLPRHRLEGARP